MKTCQTCKNPKQEKEFYKHPKNKDGYFKNCKSCMKAKRDNPYRVF